MCIRLDTGVPIMIIQLGKKTLLMTRRYKADGFLSFPFLETGGGPLGATFLLARTHTIGRKGGARRICRGTEAMVSEIVIGVCLCDLSFP